eukprot:6564556-Pyramimonas_sp.AAC.1
MAHLNSTRLKAPLGPRPLFPRPQRQETEAGRPPGVLDLALGGSRPSAVAIPNIELHHWLA